MVKKQRTKEDEDKNQKDKRLMTACFLIIFGRICLVTSLAFVVMNTLVHRPFYIPGALACFGSSIVMLLIAGRLTGSCSWFKSLGVQVAMIISFSLAAGTLRHCIRQQSSPRVTDWLVLLVSVIVFCGLSLLTRQKTRQRKHKVKKRSTTPTTTAPK